MEIVPPGGTSSNGIGPGGGRMEIVPPSDNIFDQPDVEPGRAEGVRRWSRVLSGVKDALINPLKNLTGRVHPKETLDNIVNNVSSRLNNQQALGTLRSAAVTSLVGMSAGAATRLVLMSVGGPEAWVIAGAAGGLSGAAREAYKIKTENPNIGLIEALSSGPSARRIAVAAVIGAGAGVVGGEIVREIAAIPGVKEAVQHASEVVKDNVGAGAGAVWNFVKGAPGGIGETASGLVEEGKEEVSKVKIPDVGGWINEKTAAISKSVGEVTSSVKLPEVPEVKVELPTEAVSQAWETVKQTGGGLIEQGKNTVSGLTQKAPDLSGIKTPDVGQFVSDRAQELKGTVSGLAQNAPDLGQFVNDRVGEAKDTVSGLAQKAPDLSGIRTPDVGQFVSDRFEEAKNTVSGLTSSVPPEQAKTVADQVTSIPGKAIETGKSVIEQAPDTTRGAVETVGQVKDNAWEKLQGAWKGIFGSGTTPVPTPDAVDVSQNFGGHEVVDDFGQVVAQPPAPAPATPAPVVPPAAPAPEVGAPLPPSPATPGEVPLPPQPPAVPFEAPPPAAPPVDAAPSIAGIKNSIIIEAGSNPWRVISQYGEEVLHRKLTLAEILDLTKLAVGDNDIAVDQWGIPGKILHTNIPVGFELKLDSVNNTLAKMAA